MEFYQVNFEVIEEAFLSAESKEHIQQIFLAIATSALDSELRCLTSANLPPSLRSLPTALSLTNDKAVTLVISLHNLMKEYIGTSMMDENVLAARFPPTFKKALKTLIFKTMREVAPTAKKYLQEEFSGLPKLRDFDWRLDVKTASKNQERMKQPVLYVELDLEGRGNAQKFEGN